MNQNSPNRIIRTICYFTNNITDSIINRLEEISQILIKKGYVIQTKRICSPLSIKDIENKVDDESTLLSVGTLSLTQTNEELKDFYSTRNVFFNIDLSLREISSEYVRVLFNIIKNQPNKTFNFAYTFNNKHSSPYFPSSSYATNGFSVGLQPTDLSESCQSIYEWLDKMKTVWIDIYNLFNNNKEFLGIDSSIAPLFSGESSLIHFINRLYVDFSHSATTNAYLQITEFIKKENPKPVGLCGIMFPCLEDFELAKEYNNGNFSIERNIYLSLHSGLGIDTYPIGIDERPERVSEILKLLQALSNKYKKPLSARFVTDGKAKIGEKTDFQNQFLKDVTIRKL